MQLSVWLRFGLFPGLLFLAFPIEASTLQSVDESKEADDVRQWAGGQSILDAFPPFVIPAIPPESKQLLGCFIDQIGEAGIANGPPSKASSIKNVCSFPLRIKAIMGHLEGAGGPCRWLDNQIDEVIAPGASSSWNMGPLSSSKRSCVARLDMLVVEDVSVVGPERTVRFSAEEKIPQPQLEMTGTELYSTDSGSFVRYRYDVRNKLLYPSELFSPAQNLPACGLNTNSSRSWVDFYDSNGKRLYGFCALDDASKLGQIWFALPKGASPPSQVYIEITDRQTGTKYRSNLAGTSL